MRAQGWYGRKLSRADRAAAVGQALLIDCREPQSYGTAASHGHWYHFWAHVDGVDANSAGKILGLPKLVPVTLPLSRIQPHFDVLFEHLEQDSLENLLAIPRGA